MLMQDENHVGLANATARKDVAAKNRDQVRSTMVLVVRDGIEPGGWSRGVGTELCMGAARSLHTLGMRFYVPALLCLTDIVRR